MKKIVVLFSLILFAQSAFAFVDSAYLKDERFLVNTGYSAEMAKMINVVAGDPYREVHKEGHGFKALMKRTYHYLAPTEQADLDMYNHSGSFNGTSWKDY